MSGRIRAVITGLGTVTAVPGGAHELWRVVCDPPAGPPKTGLPIFEATEAMSAKEARRSAIFTQLGVVAGLRALNDAGLDASLVDPRRGATVLSTLFGAQLEIDEGHRRLQEGGQAAVPGHLCVAAPENIAAATLSAQLGWRGPARLLVAACAGGTHAIADAVDLVRTGRYDAVVAGGTQAAAGQTLDSSGLNIRLVSPTGWLRPFDHRRDGMVPTQGSAAVVVESLDHARQRGGRIYAEVLGSANTVDAGSMTVASGPGAVECLEDALADAGLDIKDIAHVNAHGSGTVLGDAHEAEVLHAVFGPSPPPTSTVRPLLGHPLGASGAIDAVTASLSLYHQVVPPMAEGLEQEPGLDLDLVIGKARQLNGRAVMSNSFAFGGHNGSLVLGPSPR